MMTDEAQGEAIDRLAVINDMMLEMSGEECLDYTYESFLEASHSLVSRVSRFTANIMFRRSPRLTGEKMSPSCGGRGCGRPALSLDGIRQLTRYCNNRNNKSYDDSVKLKRTEMDHFRLG